MKRSSKPEATPGQENWSLVLDSAFVNDAQLFQALGVKRHEIDDFSDLYGQLDIQNRPALSPYFDSEYYLRKNPDVRSIGLDPFYHFVVHGISESRDPHPLISLEHISEAAAVRPSDLSTEILLHCLEVNLTNPTPYFDVDFYLTKYPNAKDHLSGALHHFLTVGSKNGFQPNEFFMSRWYCERYADVPKDGLAAFMHFVEIGDSERRFPSPAFDPDWYIHAHKDVQASKLSPLEHFLLFGRAEGRQPRAPNSSNATIDQLTALAAASSFGPPPAVGEVLYVALKRKIVDKRNARTSDFVESDIRLVQKPASRPSEEIQLKTSSRPVVSILIPCFKELSYTLECLQSIMEAAPQVAFEVLVSDDASPDHSLDVIADIPGVRYFRNEKNLGFLLNCNQAFKVMKGRYLLLLNNDAQVSPGMVESLVDVLDSDEKVGAVGPQIFYPNGRLQEAGCAVNSDGTSVMVGLFEDPTLPLYSWRRDVQYCSGAGLLVRKSALKGKLFDERFTPAYCEDLDLCLRIHKNGFRIVYEPKAKLIHHLSVSMAKESQKNKLRRVVLNQQKLLEKWQDTLQDINRVRTIAFYLPQFHPTAENNLWWGEGFTEWTNVTKSVPCYEGHYQPHLPSDLGFYDLRVPETLAQQASLARRYGVDGFCVYYYNFNGRRILDKPVETILSNKDIPFNFCICWANENWSKRWDGGNHELLQEQSYDHETLATVIEDLQRFSQDRRYLRVNGKPIFVVYRPLLIPDCAKRMAAMRSYMNKRGGLYLVYVESMETVGKGLHPSELGFDASVEFPPQGIAVPRTDEVRSLRPNWNGHRYDYEGTILSAIQRTDRNFVRHPAVFPSWDNSPRQPLRGTSFDGISPEAFQVYVEEKLEEVKAFSVGDERLLFVNAWNEWAEGAHLEPDQRYGHRWLEAIRNAKLKTHCY